MFLIIKFVIFAQCVLTVISVNVTLVQNNFLSTPNSTQFRLKCEYHLEKFRQQSVQKVDISKDNNVFYSVEYRPKTMEHHEHMGVPSNIQPVTNFKKVSGIRLLETNQTHVEPNLIDGWTSVMIRRAQTERLIPGTYRCKVHYLEGSKGHHIESDKVLVEDKKESVKLRINRKTFHRNQDIGVRCEYKLLKKDTFAGLSLVKDSHEFFRYFDNKNHSFVKVPGIDTINWSSKAREIYMTIKRAQNLTAGNYACVFNFSNPTHEERVESLRDSTRIVFKNSKESKLSKTWVLMLLFMVYVNY